MLFHLKLAENFSMAWQMGIDKLENLITALWESPKGDCRVINPIYPIYYIYH